MKPVELMKSAIAIVVAGSLLVFGNDHYVVLKDVGGIFVPTLFVLVGMVMLVYGLKSFGRAFVKA